MIAMNKLLKAFLLSLSLASNENVSAHRPLLTKASCDADFGTSATALPIPDPSISWAFRHYTDCTSRILWASFENPSPEFQFYVGVGVPTLERFEEIRADALIIGPGLPPLSDEEFASLPEELRMDPVWNGENIGAYYHQSPADQSTCDHLGTVMAEASTVLNGRCDFFEPYSQTNSWRVLDADNNAIPVEGDTYYVAVFLQEDVSAKYTVALGTWVEDFRTPHDIAVPGCERDLNDYFEKEGLQAECFPVVTCPSQGPVGCEGSPVDEPVCEVGTTCEQDADTECVVAGMSYMPPMMGACGGELCPAAVNLWEMVNMRMHNGMMDMEYTGNADVDFARGMIPHHLGAVAMCRALLEDLTCTEITGIDNLDGLVHFCSHVQYEQEIEVGGLRNWLESEGLEEQAPCAASPLRNADMNTTSMPESCGFTDNPSSAKFIELNHKMHNLMAVEYSCNHTVDFVRMMIPHHAGAIEMCDIVLESTQNSYLIDLCANITLTQHAEIAWMHDWLTSRDLAVSAPCGDCSASELVMEEPCEDLLSTSSFCHGLSFGQDGYCRCDETLATDDSLSCAAPTYVDGTGIFLPESLCKRTCGLCPSSTRSIWPASCQDHMGGGEMMDTSGALLPSLVLSIAMAPLAIFL